MHHHNFDQATQEANLWLRKIDERLGLVGTGQSYAALRATLHALRDRLRPVDAVHLSAQLPVAIRGLFFEGWKMSRTPTEDDNIESFCERVAFDLPPHFPLDSRTTVEGVFDVLWQQLDLGESAKVIDLLPHSLSVLWPAIARRA